MRLAGKVAIVTGASSGLGEAIAKMYLAQGAKVVLSDLNHYEKIDDLGPDALFFSANVTKEEEVKKLLDFTLENFGRLDIIVNNAGVGDTTPLIEMSSETWSKVLAVNLNGVFYGTKIAAKYMKENNIKGSIINTASILGSVGFQGASAYCTSKGGVNQLTRTAALELASAGIRVNSIAPGFIKTKMTQGVEEDKASNDFINSMTPLGYMGEPNDIAYAAVYLASDESKYVTGSVLYVDGGWTAH
ncbi:MAG: SDR family NAD(P)-dependent oxidoreductase [Patescibacteria group bacterium]|jgi:NAD(P)-dependent dehydrogenase (short-subunit alcohol dehydrogenase family)|nr:SDR family NAD(P)-dependent oxidoreductase [Patescibacteria group bacterium]